MNKYILLVMQWLNNKESVSQKELEKSRGEAWVDYATAAYIAASAAVSGSVSHAACWVDEYFKITGENRNDYRKELNKMDGYCHVSKQIANHCHTDEDTRTYSEIFAEMKALEWAYINGEQVWLHQITDRIDVEDLREAAQSAALGDGMVLYNLYLKTIKEFN